MRFKLDENLGARGQTMLRSAGHDVATVAEQGLSAGTDERLFVVCRDEARALVTFDLDFANPLRFPPEDTAGIAVLRLPGRATPEQLSTLIRSLINALREQSIAGRLWIVEPGRIRIHDRGEA